MQKYIFAQYFANCFRKSSIFPWTHHPAKLNTRRWHMSAEPKWCFTNCSKGETDIFPLRTCHWFRGYVSSNQTRAVFWENVIFSAQGVPRKSWGTYFHVKLKNNWGPLSSLFLILAIKMHFLPIYCYFLPPYHFSCKLATNAF